VRDRETGMTLNALRERLEAAVEAREEDLRRVELDRRLSEERDPASDSVRKTPGGMRFRRSRQG